ncbi:Ku protein [soil metagenome]
MASPGRAYWKGFLRLSLVSIAVEIYNAVDSSSDISFNQIHKPSGKRVNYTKTVKGIGPIDSKDIVKGYEVDKDVYITLEPEDLDAIKLESKKTLDLQQFVPVADIDPRYFERPYYVVPTDDHAMEGYLVIRDALAKTKKVGVGQITLSGREYLAAIGPVERGLVMEIMRYSSDLKPAKTYFHDLPDMKVDQEMLDLATELIGRKSGPFKPEAFSDRYAVALADLVKEKSAGRRIVAKSDDKAAPSNVVNLMDALRKSVGEGKSTKKAEPPKKRGGRRSA